MAGRAKRLLNLARRPRAVPAAIVRRIVPRSPKYGFPWVQQADGSITFQERGFVSAPSPSMLLARHNFEVARIHYELRDVSAHRSLEIGCGFGRLSMAIAEHADAHTAIDINDEALAAARAAYPSIDFRKAGALSLPFPEDHFDLVVTWTVLQHIRPGQIEVAAAEIQRVMAPGGTLLICEETRDPEGGRSHTWHRHVGTYEQLFVGLSLVRHGYIEEIATIPGLESPGEVMSFCGIKVA
jgi:SAM-dependent methyltransferase